jgi:hypothetical protein
MSARKSRQQTKPNSPSLKPSNLVDITFGENHSLIYSDSIRVGINAYDIRMGVGLVIGNKNNKLQIQEQATIIFSPQHAKEVARVLLANVEEYEKKIMKLEMKIDSTDSEEDEQEEQNESEESVN